MTVFPLKRERNEDEKMALTCNCGWCGRNCGGGWSGFKDGWVVGWGVAVSGCPGCTEAWWGWLMNPGVSWWAAAIGNYNRTKLHSVSFTSIFFSQASRQTKKLGSETILLGFWHFPGKLTCARPQDGRCWIPQAGIPAKLQAPGRLHVGCVVHMGMWAAAVQIGIWWGALHAGSAYGPAPDAGFDTGTCWSWRPQTKTQVINFSPENHWVMNCIYRYLTGEVTDKKFRKLHVILPTKQFTIVDFHNVLCFLFSHQKAPRIQGTECIRSFRKSRKECPPCLFN